MIGEGVLVDVQLMTTFLRSVALHSRNCFRNDSIFKLVFDLSLAPFFLLITD
jgi:hypothetical protein